MLRVLLLDRGLLVIHAQNLRQALDVVETPIAAAIATSRRSQPISEERAFFCPMRPLSSCIFLL